jgi:hypothetical protein
LLYPCFLYYKHMNIGVNTFTYLVLLLWMNVFVKQVSRSNVCEDESRSRTCSDHAETSKRTFKKVSFDYATARNSVRCLAAIENQP